MGSVRWPTSAAITASSSRNGHTKFKNLLFRREGPFFYAFDVLSIEGEDLTRRPLLEQAPAAAPHADGRSTAGCSISSTSRSAGATWVASPASATSKASSASGHRARIARTAA